jgi:ABC-2 type transport system permease protein
MRAYSETMHGAPLMPFGRLLRAYCTDARYEALRMLRAPAFAIPFLILPMVIYVLFGVLIAGPGIGKDPQLTNLLFIGFAVMAVIGPALFGVGSTLAPERDAGLMKLKRALPVPTGSYLLAKMFMSMFFAGLALALMACAAALAGELSLSFAQLVAVSGVLVVGALPFCALGLFIGAHCSGSAAPGVTNLIYLPMLWLGGLFVPLPAFLQKWVVVWPAFHLQQVAVAAAGIGKYQFLPPQISAGILVGITVIFGGLAIRRLARVG